MKIGILTHYYNNRNYGGLLQAYALTRFVRTIVPDTEQICYQWSMEPYSTESSFNGENQLVQGKSESFFKKLLLHFPRRINDWKLKKIRDKEKQKYYVVNQYNEAHALERETSFDSFQSLVPHSTKIYSANDIYETNDIYDCFITGSDQVWNMRWFNPAFFLEHCLPQKIRVAYAVSMGKGKLTDYEKEYLHDVLPQFRAISVREKDLVQLLETVEKKFKATYVLDPVFLLNTDQWDEVVSKPLVSEEYIFCYILSEKAEIKRLIKQYAKRINCKTVFIPYAHGFNEYGDSYGDINIHSAGPAEFVSLIKNAKCVITDSFHATAFSIIYNKEFFVFNRNGLSEMSSRIVSLTKMAHCESRFCHLPEHKRVTYLLNQPHIDYYSCNKDIEKMKKISMTFLKNSLFD